MYALKGMKSTNRGWNLLFLKHEINDSLLKRYSVDLNPPCEAL